MPTVLIKSSLSPGFKFVIFIFSKNIFIQVFHSLTFSSLQKYYSISFVPIFIIFPFILTLSFSNTFFSFLLQSQAKLILISLIPLYFCNFLHVSWESANRDLFLGIAEKASVVLREVSYGSLALTEQLMKFLKPFLTLHHYLHLLYPFYQLLSFFANFGKCNCIFHLHTTTGCTYTYTACSDWLL